MKTNMNEAFDSKSYAQAWQLRNTKLIEDRKVMEMEINKFLDSLSKLSDATKEKCGVVDGLTCQSLLPELWVEEPNQEVYDKQFANLQAYINKVAQVANEINMEASKCLQFCQ